MKKYTWEIFCLPELYIDIGFIYFFFVQNDFSFGIVSRKWNITNQYRIQVNIFFFGREKKQDYYYRYILDICNITHEEKRFQIKILYIHILRIEKNIWKYNQIN